MTRASRAATKSGSSSDFAKNPSTVTGGKFSATMNWVDGTLRDMPFGPDVEGLRVDLAEDMLASRGQTGRSSTSWPQAPQR